MAENLPQCHSELFALCHSERSEESGLAQSKLREGPAAFLTYPALRFFASLRSAQNDMSGDTRNLVLYRCHINPGRLP